MQIFNNWKKIWKFLVLKSFSAINSVTLARTYSEQNLKNCKKELGLDLFYLLVTLVTKEFRFSAVGLKFFSANVHFQGFPSLLTLIVPLVLCYAETGCGDYTSLRRRHHGSSQKCCLKATDRLSQNLSSRQWTSRYILYRPLVKLKGH